MRITPKGRSAVTALLDLALHRENAPVALVRISERQGLSLSYLEVIFRELRDAGIVEAVRGPGGGYTLARPLPTVTVADIMLAVDKPRKAAPGGAKGNGDSAGGKADDLWTVLNQRMMDYLVSVSLKDLIER